MISVQIQRYQEVTIFPTTFRCGTFSCLDFSFMAAQLGLGLERQVFVPVEVDGIETDTKRTWDDLKDSGQLEIIPTQHQIQDEKS